MITRRMLMGSAVAMGGLTLFPTLGSAQDKRILRVIPHADLAVVDPVISSALITLVHSYMVYDTLFGTDSAFLQHPQMLDSAVVSEDQLTWTLTLRDGLMFHDGTQVRSADAAASIKRWAQNDVMGKELSKVLDEIAVESDSVFALRLNAPFPLLPMALGKPSTNMCAVMPERLAQTPASTALKEVVGSGPYRFMADEWVPGSSFAYEKFEDYVSRREPSSYTAGAKIAEFDRVEFTVVADAVTAVSALMAGEVDFWDGALPDFLPMLQGSADLKIVESSIPVLQIIRLNHTQAPFNNPEIRRALLSVVKQTDFMMAVGGVDPNLWEADVGFFNSASPMANDAGMEALRGPFDFDKARQAILDAGYTGEPVALLDNAEIASSHAVSLVLADILRKIGMTVEMIPVDWGTLNQRVANRGLPSEGGWSAYHTGITSFGGMFPPTMFILRADGPDAFFGWPDSPEIEQLRAQWLATPDLEQQREIARNIQTAAFRDVPYIPVGVTKTFYAAKSDIVWSSTEFPHYYNMMRS